MNYSDRTPVKQALTASDGDGITAASTPQQHLENGDAEENELMDTFSAMKVSYHGALSKRLADSDTIEGSPVNPGRFKRLDLHPTPQKLYDAALGMTSCPPNVTKRAAAPCTTNTHTQPDKVLERKLVVICSASEEHNTGDHQENALRTALLCGSEGCLRREELADSIVWIDSDNLTPAPLTDLLR
jgi:hypothetical protein